MKIINALFLYYVVIKYMSYDVFNRCKLQIAACNKKELYSKDPVILYNNYRICKKHFNNKMFLNYEKTRLQPHAIPSSNDNIGTY